MRCVHFRYDVVTIDCVEAAVLVAPDADNPGFFWAVIDDDFCPWHEVRCYGAVVFGCD